jgi:exopolyphosphatase / guanosine-5'-triphosphate,3'-diphosphate pyrophosphatase
MRRGSAGGDPLAVIDVGSNSARMVVFRSRDGGHLDVVEDARAPLRLALELGDDGALGPQAIERTLEALRDFRAVALGAGATTTLAVATAAVREAADGMELVRRARQEVGIEIEVVDGDREAELGFLGAVHDLPVRTGLTMDVGGGSMDVARFQDRQLTGSWTLPLGALRLSSQFLASDPPTEKEIRRLVEEVTQAVREAGIPATRPGDSLVGIGGTVRNLAKIDRRRQEYPLPLLHGYVIPERRLRDLVAFLAGRRMARRRSVPGLNPDRADSIVGGAAAVHGVTDAVGADRLIVSSRGLREGIALRLLAEQVPSPVRVRAASVANLAGRFRTWDQKAGERRAQIASRLLETLDPEADPAIQEMLEHAALVLDVGRAMDYYERFEHAATIVTAADLGGFTHADLGRLTAILRQADDDTRLGQYGALLAKADREPVLRAATVLALADEINRRIPPGRPGSVACEWRNREFAVEAPVLAGWHPRGIAERFGKVFRRRLVVEAGSG